jgi:Nucleotide modification associated domain 1
MLTLAERNEKFLKLTKRMYELQDRKGQDYGENKDGLKNLRRKGVAGIVARMGDKLSRIENLTEPGRQVAVMEETLEDTLLDLANYSLLLIILREDLIYEADHVKPNS